MCTCIKSTVYPLSILCLLVNLGISFAICYVEKNTAFYLNLVVFLWNLVIAIVLICSKKDSETLASLSIFQLWFPIPYLIGILVSYWFNDNSSNILFGENEMMTYGFNMIGLLIHAILLYLAGKVKKCQERRRYYHVFRTTKRTVTHRARASENIEMI